MKRLLLGLALALFSAFALAAVNINTATKEELDVLPQPAAQRLVPLPGRQPRDERGEGGGDRHRYLLDLLV